MPYKDKPNHHRHKCTKCKTVWEHEDGSDNESHFCPNCGKEAKTKNDAFGIYWVRYKGKEKPNDKPLKS